MTHKYFDSNYSNTPEETEELRQFISKSYRVSLRPFNWRLAVLENDIFASRYLESPDYFTNRIHIWRTDSGDLAAFVIRGTNFVHLQVDYECRSIEPEIIDWAERHLLNRKQQISLMVYDWDTERKRLLTERGYQNLGAIEDVHIYDLDREFPAPSLPPGFRFTTMAESISFAGRVELENQVWGVSLTENWLRGKQTSPSYTRDGDLLVLAPDGQMAAFSLIWLYPDTQTAEIDPLGTHPDFRQQGLARALVLESFRRMRHHGIRFAYIGSETVDPIVSHLYSSLQPAEFYQGFHWTKLVNN